jgi:protein-disulfide isomerase
VKRILPFVIVALVALSAIGGGIVLYRAKKPATLSLTNERSTSDTATLHIRGNAKAPVTIDEYGDYECPPCGRLAAPISQIEHDFGDKVRLIFHHFPLIVHAHAKEAAYAAEAAALQNKFWEMHDTLYREQAIWAKVPQPRDLFNSYAEKIGLDVERFKKDIDSPPVKERVEKDQSDGTKIGVTSTPTVFVNNKSISMTGPESPKLIREAVEAALNPKPAS